MTSSTLHLAELGGPIHPAAPVTPTLSTVTQTTALTALSGSAALLHAAPDADDTLLHRNCDYARSVSHFVSDHVDNAADVRTSPASATTQAADAAAHNSIA
jgi:hypothetical protein